MITCGPNHPAITRGCLILLIIAVAAFGVCAVTVAAVDAQACQRSLVTPLNQFANVRTEPNTTSAIKRQLQAGQTAEATGPTNGWYTLTAGGYVSATVVNATCLTASTPTRIPSSTPNVAPILFKVCIDYFEAGQAKTQCNLYPEVVHVGIEAVKP